MSTNSGESSPELVPSVSHRCAVGVIGLGIMGSLYASHLLNTGLSVAGFDISEDRRRQFEQAGGALCVSAAEVVDRADVVITALSSIAAYRSVMLGPNSVTHRAQAAQLFVEMGTLPIALKEEARESLARRGAQMIDAPVTGTRVHAERKELVVYASGDEAAVARVRPVLEAFASNIRFVGPFGSGMKLKMVTNHLVAVHNVAAAEALALAESAGLDLKQVYDLIAGGPASSAVFGFRGPFMIENRYEPPTMRMDVFEKDLQIIDDFARTLRAATPLFQSSTTIYRAALAQGMKSEDVSAVFNLNSSVTPLPG